VLVDHVQELQSAAIGRSRTPTGETPGCLDTCRSITASGSTQPSAADPLSSGSASCSAELRARRLQLDTIVKDDDRTQEQGNDRGQRKLKNFTQLCSKNTVVTIFVTACNKLKLSYELKVTLKASHESSFMRT